MSPQIDNLADRLGALTELDALAVIGADVTTRDEGYYVEHCGEPMVIGSGVFGPDIVRCEACGARIERPDSPHINGGIVLSDEAYAALAERHWVPIPAESISALEGER